MPPKNASKCSTPTCRNPKITDTQLCDTCTRAGATAVTKALGASPQAAPNLASLSTFPMASLANVQVDSAVINAACEKFNKNQVIDDEDFKKSLFGLLANLCTSLNNYDTKLKQVKAEVAHNSDRIKSLEDKIGDMNECSVPLSITMQKLPKAPIGISDMDAAKQVIRAINAEGVNAEDDVIKVSRKGFKPATATQSEWGGTVFVELKSAEVKAKVMKAKKCLANNSDLKDLRISNMKTQQQINQDYFNRQVLKLIPDGHQFYISGTGALRRATHMQGRQGPPLPHAPIPYNPATFNPATLPPSHPGALHPPVQQSSSQA